MCKVQVDEKQRHWRELCYPASCKVTHVTHVKELTTATSLPFFGWRNKGKIITSA